MADFITQVNQPAETVPYSGKENSGQERIYFEISLEDNISKDFLFSHTTIIGKYFHKLSMIAQIVLSLDPKTTYRKKLLERTSARYAQSPDSVRRCVLVFSRHPVA